MVDVSQVLALCHSGRKAFKDNSENYHLLNLIQHHSHLLNPPGLQCTSRCERLLTIEPELHSLAARMHLLC